MRFGMKTILMKGRVHRFRQCRGGDTGQVGMVQQVRRQFSVTPLPGKDAAVGGDLSMFTHVPSWVVDGPRFFVFRFEHGDVRFGGVAQKVRSSTPVVRQGGFEIQLQSLLGVPHGFHQHWSTFGGRATNFQRRSMLCAVPSVGGVVVSVGKAAAAAAGRSFFRFVGGGAGRRPEHVGFNHTKQSGLVFLFREWPCVADFRPSEKDSHVAGRNVFTKTQLIFDVLDRAPGLDPKVQFVPVRKFNFYLDELLLLGRGRGGGGWGGWGGGGGGSILLHFVRCVFVLDGWVGGGGGGGGGGGSGRFAGDAASGQHLCAVVGLRKDGRHGRVWELHRRLFR